jgi:NADH-quinone oxidoreductase subunit E
MAFVLSAEREREMSEILTRYPSRRPACIPILHLCQDQEGYVSEEAMVFVAEKLGLSTAQVKGVVTFYTVFNTSPVGKHQVWVCKTLSCSLRGAKDIIKHCEKRLGVHVGETTKDGKVTLRTAECLASCGTAPMMQVDKKYYENLTPAEVDRILDRLLGS